MKKAFEKVLALAAASVVALAVVSSVASLADRDRAALALAKQPKAQLLAAAAQHRSPAR